MSLQTLQIPPSAIDPEIWPAVARVPSGAVAAVAAAVAERLLRRAAARLPLRLVYPDGMVVGAADPTLPALLVHQPDALARRMGRHGLIGFGESYMAGEWSSDDLTGLLTVLAGSVDELVPRTLQRLRPIGPAFRPRWRVANRDQARRDVARHYDLSNELFAEFLDETMTYSSALFNKLSGSARPKWSDLAGAQRRKIDRLLDFAGVQAGSRVLEIGTGWGELCIRAAARGARVRSVTLSMEQQRLARQRVAAAGLADLVQIDLCDYRDVMGSSDRNDPYDVVVSVEMVEAVGYHSWPRYFATLERLVRPGGRVAIQAITMSHQRMLATRNTHTWIQKYIFPGGLLPSTQAIAGITERRTGLRTVDMASLRPHYAETLRLWRERFAQRRDELARLGFDEVFGRMWELYLAYSEAGFRSGYLDVYQWTFEREVAP
jgi:cyclopropane-fatty-acyl-phospholipid synthase